MTGVSPIIAVILMVAITVVLAATIYVWVSGFGAGGSKTPAMSVSADNVHDKFIITDVDSGVNWTDMSIKVSTDAGNAAVTLDDNTLYNTSDSTNYTGYVGIDVKQDVHAGDEIEVSWSSGANSVTIYLRYDPTDAILGSWTVYI